MCVWLVICSVYRVRVGYTLVIHLYLLHHSREMLSANIAFGSANIQRYYDITFSTAGVWCILSSPQDGTKYKDGKIYSGTKRNIAVYFH